MHWLENDTMPYCIKCGTPGDGVFQTDLYNTWCEMCFAHESRRNNDEDYAGPVKFIGAWARGRSRPPQYMLMPTEWEKYGYVPDEYKGLIPTGGGCTGWSVYAYDSMIAGGSGEDEIIHDLATPCPRHPEGNATLDTHALISDLEAMLRELRPD